MMVGSRRMFCSTRQNIYDLVTVCHILKLVITNIQANVTCQNTSDNLRTTLNISLINTMFLTDPKHN